MEILHKELSYRIVGCAMHVHREIGPGLDEAPYHIALHERLLSSGLGSEYKPTRRLVYKGTLADEFEADLIVDGCIALELKSLSRDFAPAHYTQLMCYLKCWRLQLGVLFDFGKESLVHKRVVHAERSIGVQTLSPDAMHLAPVSEQELLSSVLSSLCDIAHAHGVGYRDTTYRGLFRAELTARGMKAEERNAEIWCDGRHVGFARPDCLIVDGRCAVTILALYERLHAAHRARLQTCLKHLGLAWGVLVNYGKKSLDWQYVTAPQIHSRVP